MQKLVMVIEVGLDEQVVLFEEVNVTSSAELLPLIARVFEALVMDEVWVVHGLKSKSPLPSGSCGERQLSPPGKGDSEMARGIFICRTFGYD